MVVNMTNVTKGGPRQFLAIVLTFQFALWFAILFDVSVARQVIGFLYLTFIPGFVILKLLKMDELDTIEDVLFSAGLSIAILMFVGLFVNETGPLIGMWTPLETTPMIISISGCVLIGVFVYFLRNMRNTELGTENVRITLRSLIFLIIPILSIIGAFWVNTTGNSSLLLLTILVVATVFVLGICSEKIVSPEYYALVVFSIALAVLFHTSLTSNYIYGNDIHNEYYTFKMTQNSAYWNSSASIQTGFNRYSDMLSITVLPTVYSNILNIDGTWLLKVIFPLIFSLVPVVLLKMWQIKWGKKTAFISALLLISQATFYTEMLSLDRQMIAELFLVLLLFLLFSKKLDSPSSKLCFIIFSAALIISHYAMALIFLFIIFGTWLSLLWVGKRSRKVTLFYVVFFAVAMFSWYIFTYSGASFQSILQFGDYLRGQLGNFFNPASRGSGVMLGLGMEAPQSNWQTLSRIFAYTTQLFIVIGFASVLIKRKKMNIDWDYFFVLSLGMVLLALTIVLPGFASTLNMTRFYHIILLLIAPFLVIGYETCINFLRRIHIMRKTQFQASILMTVILVAYFLFQISFVYEVVGDRSWSIPLSMYRMDKTQLFGWGGYVDEQGVLGAQWLSRNVDVKNTELYSDAASLSYALRSYGGTYQGNIWTNTSEITGGGVLYLSPLNVVYGKIYDSNIVWNYSELSNQLEFLGKIYSNGGSEVWSSSMNVTNP